MKTTNTKTSVDQIQEMDVDSMIACKLFWQLVVKPQFVAIYGFTLAHIAGCLQLFHFWDQEVQLQHCLGKPTMFADDRKKGGGGGGIGSVS